jgi:hypothetical protein
MNQSTTMWGFESTVVGDLQPGVRSQKSACGQAALEPAMDLADPQQPLRQPWPSSSPWPAAWQLGALFCAESAMRAPV